MKRPLDIVLPAQSDRSARSEGFTIIELMAALTILMVGILGLAPVFIGAARSASAGMHRARALALATRDMEAYRSVPYCSLGFSTGTLPTVVVSNPAPGLPPATGTETVNGIVYTFRRAIVWTSTQNLKTSTTDSNAYKVVTVTVNWQEGSRTQQARQNTVVYPGGMGTYSAFGCGASGAQGLQAPPQAVTDLSAVTDPASPTTTVELRWTNPVGANYGEYRVVYSSDNFASSFLFADIPITEPQPYRVSTLSSGATYQFQLLSWRESTGESTPSNRVTVQTQTTAPAGCTIGAIGLEHDFRRQVSGGSTLESNVNADVSAAPGCTDLRLSYVPDEGSSLKTILLLTNVAGVWKGTINGSTTDWSVGPHTISVTDVNGAVLNSSKKLTVCLTSAPCP